MGLALSTFLRAVGAVKSGRKQVAQPGRRLWPAAPQPAVKVSGPDAPLVTKGDHDTSRTYLLDEDDV
ncbi:hypothetical protein TREES_T100000904 [Tupaia chinensis]|uniref:Uncharacterized protein n=1 Tax=Tupaia chinensis TaxID=246437 RepID=L9JFB8_TUPCH|nr:hypothetical protein TREES_T100000904 [Tupaia chinensis]